MRIASETLADKTQTALNRIHQLVGELTTFCQQAAQGGQRQYEVERGLWQQILKIGQQGMDLYLHSLGEGDLGESLTTAQGETLCRSEQPKVRPLRTLFGEHLITAYVYAAGPKQKIALRPIDALIELPPGTASYLYEEFSQFLCVEQAFGTGQRQFEQLFQQRPSVDSLERLNRRLGEQAEDFLDHLPLPPTHEEGELLVVTGDGKGVPLVTEDARSVPVFDSRERPGNRRMAVLGGVYTVDRFVRTPEDILKALFREESEAPPPKRPQPKFKELVGRFSRTYEDSGESLTVPGAMETFSWVGQRVEQRHQPGQTVVLLMDGQPTLWETAAFCLKDAGVTAAVEILDVIHVASYVWRAAKVFESAREHREAFAWTRLKRILEGDVKGVIRGLRQMAKTRQLASPARQEMETVCRYFRNNQQRMRYDEYLQAGFPIATGVIEGACRHVVKDRLERSGMRWTLAGAQAMLNVRCVFASSYWDAFQVRRMQTEQKQIHPHRNLVPRRASPSLKP